MTLVNLLDHQMICVTYSPVGGAVTHQSCGGFSIHSVQIDLLILLLLLLLLLTSLAALDADTQTADQNQQTSAHKDGVARPSRHCRRQDGWT